MGSCMLGFQVLRTRGARAGSRRQDAGCSGRVSCFAAAGFHALQRQVAPAKLNYTNMKLFTEFCNKAFLFRRQGTAAGLAKRAWQELLRQGSMAERTKKARQQGFRQGLPAGYGGGACRQGSKQGLPAGLQE